MSCLQATFCGSSMGKKKGLHFTAQDFEAMGYDFCDTLLDYCDPDTSKVRMLYILLCRFLSEGGTLIVNCEILSFTI